MIKLKIVSEVLLTNTVYNCHAILNLLFVFILILNTTINIGFNMTFLPHWTVFWLELTKHTEKLLIYKNIDVNMT